MERECEEELCLSEDAWHEAHEPFGWYEPGRQHARRQHGHAWRENDDAGNRGADKNTEDKRALDGMPHGATSSAARPSMDPKLCRCADDAGDVV